MNRAIVYACSDLVWATRIRAAADSMGVRAGPVRSPDALGEALAAGGIGGLILDIELGNAGLALIARAKAGPEPCPVVAFGPHVDAQALAAARDAGADRVLARGVFADRLPRVLAELAGG